MSTQDVFLLRKNKRNNLYIQLIYSCYCVKINLLQKGVGSLQGLGIKTEGNGDLKYHNTVEPVLNSHSKIDKPKVLKTNGCLMQVQSIAECFPWSILQYFCPALSGNWS